MEFRKSQPIYLQISDVICERILSGEWPVDERIPSVRELAENIAVNPNTVQRTYAWLQEKEIIYNKRGIGYFVAEKASAKVLSVKKEAFVQEELPWIFKTMDLLEISFEDLRQYYLQIQQDQ